MANSEITYINNGRKTLNRLNIGIDDVSGRKTYSKNILLNSDQFAKTIRVANKSYILDKIRSTVYFDNKMLISGDFGILYLDEETKQYRPYIGLYDGGDRFSDTGWYPNAVYSVSVISHTDGDRLVIVGNFETVELLGSDMPIFSSKNFLVVALDKDTKKLYLPYPNIKLVSSQLPMIQAQSFPLISTETSGTEKQFADDSIVSVYGYQDHIFIIDKGIFSFKDIEINDYGIIDSDSAFIEPVSNVFNINLATANIEKYSVAGEILSDTLLDNKVKIMSGVRKVINNKNYHQTLLYNIDLINNVFEKDFVINNKVSKFLPINDRQSYLVLPQNIPLQSIAEVERPLSVSNSQYEVEDSDYFGNGSDGSLLKTNDLYQIKNSYSEILANTKGLLTLNVQLKWLPEDIAPPSTLVLNIIKNKNIQLLSISYNPNDLSSTLVATLLPGDIISFDMDENFRGLLAIDFDAKLDNIDIFYADSLAFLQKNSSIKFTQIHNGIKTNQSKHEKVAVLLDEDKNVWFLKSENQDYFIDLLDYSNLGSRLIKYNLPSDITPVKAVLGLDVIAVLAEDGNIYTWGKNTLGQLGNKDISLNSNINQKPIKVTNINNNFFIDLDVCNNTFYAINKEGQMFAWGSNIINAYVQSHTGPEENIPDGITEADSAYKISTGLIPNLIDEYSNSPYRVYLILGTPNTIINRACGVINSENIGQAAKLWSKVSVGPTDVYAIDNLGVLYYWGGYDSHSIMSFDKSISYYKPRPVNNLPVMFGVPGYSVVYATENEIISLQTSYNNSDKFNYYFDSNLSNIVQEEQNIPAVTTNNLPISFKNRVINKLSIKNPNTQFDIINLDTSEFIKNSNVFVKNVVAGELIFRCKIIGKTSQQFTSNNGVSLSVDYVDIVAPFNGIIVLDTSAINNLQSINLCFYNIYIEKFDTVNPGSYTDVVHDSYIFANPYSNTSINKEPILSGYSRTNSLIFQQSHVSVIKTANNDVYIWSKNTIDKDTNNTFNAINSVSQSDYTINYPPQFNHELIGYTHETSQLLIDSLYHSHIKNNSQIIVRLRAIDNSVGTQLYNRCSSEACPEYDLSAKDLTTLSLFKNKTPIRISSVTDNVLSLDSGIINRDSLFRHKKITDNTGYYAITQDGDIYILSTGGLLSQESLYNFSYLINDTSIFSINKSDYPNFVNSNAFITDVSFYNNIIILAGFFPEGNSQINQDNEFVLWDHFEKFVLNPFSSGA